MDLIGLPDDMTQDEKDAIVEYRQNGCPGLVKIDSEKVTQWFELYVSGKTYAEIAEISHFNKNIILYVAHRGKWNDKKMSKINDIASSLWNKTCNSKIEGANTVATFMSAMNRYYINKLNKYLATNDDAIIENLDTNLLGKYHKTIEMLEKLIASGNPASIPLPPNESPSVNININGPTEIVDGSNSIDINQLDKKPSSGEILKALLALKNSK
ncbi:MAG TPA: hypothetical protein VI911_11675 [Patescibacteria group bacterium]|nr:hypothetical protein [Patescibacteria group bacterium]